MLYGKSVICHKGSSARQTEWTSEGLQLQNMHQQIYLAIGRKNFIMAERWIMSESCCRSLWWSIYFIAKTNQVARGDIVYERKKDLGKKATVSIVRWICPARSLQGESQPRLITRGSTLNHDPAAYLARIYGEAWKTSFSALKNCIFTEVGRSRKETRIGR